MWPGLTCKNALELRLSFSNPSLYLHFYWWAIVMWPDTALRNRKNTADKTGFPQTDLDKISMIYHWYFKIKIWNFHNDSKCHKCKRKNTQYNGKSGKVFLLDFFNMYSGWKCICEIPNIFTCVLVQSCVYLTILRFSMRNLPKLQWCSLNLSF